MTREEFIDKWGGLIYPPARTELLEMWKDAHLGECADDEWEQLTNIEDEDN